MGSAIYSLFNMIRLNALFLCMSATLTGDVAPNFTALDGSVQSPFLLHSNGYHFVLKRDTFRPILRRYERGGALKRSLLSYPVLLLDSYEHGACNLTTLGWLANLTREGAPSLKLAPRDVASALPLRSS